MASTPASQDKRDDQETVAITRSPSLSAARVDTLDDATIRNETDSANEKDKDTVVAVEQQNNLGGLSFWLVFVSIMMATFVSALDVTAISTALPTIIADLDGAEFTWVGSSYTLASTAFLPLSGGLAQIFGRKPAMLGSLAFFFVGSGLCGGASSLNMLIAGRTVQGVGTGGILALSEIIIADLVPLQQRGIYFGMLGAVWAVAAASGPPLAGAIADWNWRWIFYLNLPLTGVAMVLVFLFLQVKAPGGDLRSKLRRMDFRGNILVVAATTAAIIGITWGGSKYAWDSPRVLAPLILGVLGLVAFIAYEAFVPIEPVVPFELFKNRTSLSGYLSTFWHSVLVACVTFYVPVYFQAVKEQSPVRSGVTFLGTAAIIAPGAIMCGASVSIFKIYRPQNILVYVLALIGLGILSLLDVNSTTAQMVGYQIIVGFSLGLGFAATTFPILAPLPLSESAHALAFLAFARNFANTWGITVGSTILQNELKRKLPAEFLALLSSSHSVRTAELTYAAIPIIPSLPEPLKSQVKIAFADSLRMIWYVMIGVAGLALVTTVVMKEIPMQTTTDENWGVKEKGKSEKGDGKESA